MVELKFDKIGYWSEIKIDIIRKYAKAYSTIIKARGNLTTAYIDAFSGPGKHIRKDSKEEVIGSPLAALEVRPAFDEYYFIDISSKKIDYLKSQISGRENIRCMVGDANDRLFHEVFPNVKYTDFKRALCVLDPYGLHLDWNVIQAAGDSRSTEIFLNFPVADMNRNVFWRNPKGVGDNDIARMTRFWGDETWREAAYKNERDLFGDRKVRTDNETIAKAFRDRLRKKANFKFVPPPLPMRNNQNAIVYYLFFASQNRIGEKIVKEIFDKHRSRKN